MVIVLSLVFAAVAAAVPLQRVLLADGIVESYGARCLDGSPAGYYLREAPGSNDWVLSLEGGGLCETAKDCKRRTQGPLGSSKFWTENFTDGGNVLNDNPAENPFASFNAVFIPYCSGDTHLGKNKYKNIWLGGLYTSGHLILEAVLDHLYNTTSMGQGVNNMLLTGRSAGGIGALHNADWLTQTVAQKFGFKDAVVKASPQAGLFFPSQPKQGVCIFPEFKILGEICPRSDIIASWFVERLVEGGAYADESCMAALGNPRSCWNAGILARYVTTPLFFAQNRYDKQQMTAEMLCNECTADASKISAKGKAYMEYFGKRTETVLRDLDTNFNHSVFMPNCYEHGANICMKGGSRIDGQTYNTSLSDWFFKGVHHAHYDTCGDFPCSKICSCSSPDAETVV